MKFLVLIGFLFSFLFAQQPDADELLNNLKSKYSDIKDYSATVNVEVNLNLIKMKNKNNKVFYKSPDKFKFKSEGFGLLPKQAANINPDELLKFDHTALFMKTETIENNICNVVRIIPMEDSLDIILTTLWIDQEKHFIRKVESNSKTAGSIKIIASYDADKKFPLPDQINIEINGGMPEESDSKNTTTRSSKPIYGNVLIKYSDYRINKGIDDKIFIETND